MNAFNTRLNRCCSDDHPVAGVTGAEKASGAFSVGMTVLQQLTVPGQFR